jgi:hypothetical protein
MYNDPNQPQQYPYGQQPPPYGQAPYGQPQQQPPQQYGQPQYGIPQIPNYGPPQQQQMPKKRRRWPWIVLGIVVVLVVVCGGGGLLLANLLTHNGATDVTNQYFTAVENQNYNTAFTYLDTSHLQLNGQGITQQLYVQGAMLYDQAKGKLSAYSITSTSLNANNGVNTAMLTVSETRNGSSYDVHVQLMQEGSVWKITSLDNF